MKKLKLQAKIQEATRKRIAERRENNRRAAWNRVGKQFGFSRQALDLAKSGNLNPYVLLKTKRPITVEQAQAYIQFGQRHWLTGACDQAGYSVSAELACFEQYADSELEHELAFLED